MTESEALNWVAKLFEEDPGKLTADTKREDIAAWDSLGVLTLMAGLDNDFGIILSDDQVQGMKTVGDIARVLQNRNVTA